MAGSTLGSGRGNTAAIAGGAILGGLLGAATDALVKDVTYTVIADLQISEKTRNGVQVDTISEHKLAQGRSVSASSSYAETTNRKRYQTRIVSTANKVNLEFEEASEDLVKGMVRSIAGIF